LSASSTVIVVARWLICAEGNDEETSLPCSMLPHQGQHGTLQLNVSPVCLYNKGLGDDHAHIQQYRSRKGVV
jgi:hypothetical protein